jgi:hypothetical protein
MERSDRLDTNGERAEDGERSGCLLVSGERSDRLDTDTTLGDNESLEAADATHSTTPSVIARHRCRRHGRKKGQQIQILYVIALIFWTIVILALGLWRTDLIGWIVLMVPPLVFIFGFVNANELTVEIEDQMFEANYLSVGLIIVLPLLMWINGQHHDQNPADRQHFIRIVVIALVLSMLSMIDLWVSREKVSLVKHGKSILQTASIALLIYGLYWFVQKQALPSVIVAALGSTRQAIVGEVVVAGTTGSDRP